MTESDEAASMTVTPRVLRTPELTGNLRAHSVRLPEAAQEASGIRVLGRTIRSIVYTTDIAIIRNCDADAVFAVYPFTPQQIISKAIMEASAIPVFAGVGGGTTAGPRSAALAQDAEADGAYGVVLNAPASYTTLEMVSRVIDIPVIVTVVDADRDVVANRIALEMPPPVPPPSTSPLAPRRPRWSPISGRSFPTCPSSPRAGRARRAFARRSRRVRTPSSARPRRTRSYSRE